jgi:hypothetical protein
LVFTPKDNRGLNRCAAETIEAGNNFAGRGEEAEGEHEDTSTDDAAREVVA